MSDVEPTTNTFYQFLVFLKRLFAYGLLFLFLMSWVLVSIPYLFPLKNPGTKHERIAQQVDNFSLEIPDPEQYWSSKADFHQSLSVKSERIDTLLIESFEEGEEWLCIAMKARKPILSYVHSYEMRRIFVNDLSAYIPATDAGEGMASDQLRTNTTTMLSLERLSEKIGSQTIRDLLTIGQAYYENRGVDDNHKARELMFNALRMAYAWNKQHPEAKIDVSAIPTPIIQRLKR